MQGVPFFGFAWLNQRELRSVVADYYQLPIDCGQLGDSEHGG